MITGQDIRLEVGGRTLVKDASFLIAGTDKVGLVGRNGAGKTSLLHFILGDTPSHIRADGAVRIEGTVGYLPQAPVPGGLGVDPSALSHVLSARGLDALDDHLHKAQAAMAKEPTEENISAFTELEERYRAAGGYDMEGRLARMADGLGLHQQLLFEDVSSLSGGQRRRVDLMRVLFQAPDTMVLDEPTNHLDLSAKRWLIDELRALPGSLLVVSHDLRLLDEAITKVLYLSDHQLRQFKGTYSGFRTQLSADIAQRQKTASMEAAQIQKMRAQADKWRHSTEAQARKAKILDRKVEKLQTNRTEVIKRERKVRFRLPDAARSGALPLVVRNLAVSYDLHHVLFDVDIVVERGQRVAVVGRNGVGKSSLLRCLAGIQKPTSGSVELGYNTVVGYFAQEHEQIDPERTVLGNIDDKVLPKESDRRKLLGSFGLTGAIAEQLPPSLSGGERARLSLAMVAGGAANLLVLDEPTNNLDPASVEAVGAMLATWPGTIVAVSHDRPFVEALAPTHVLRLPEERHTFWREEYLDEVELR
ncbi:MAG TPA: ABC-F family ATP-binding cassette domain-containing protein [Acidimicrobiales bacterium]|nr:ABC-F family ATP-binding cassette domain-containing protein [Acidimicrobiales bacterium]